MKTDQFDDSIKKKLDSIQPTFQEEDWDKFQAFAQAHQVPYWKVLMSKQVMYMAASITIVSLLFTTLTQYYAKKDLQQQLLSVTETRDSLLLEKEMLTQQLEHQEQKNTELALALGTSQIQEKQLKASVQRLMIDRHQSDEADFSSGDWNVAHQNSLSKGQAATGRIERDNQGNWITKNTDESEESIIKNIAIPDWRILKAKVWRLDSTDTKAQITKTNFSYYEPEDTIQGPQRMRFSLADAYVRAGVGGVVSNAQFGVGAHVELFLDKRLSISAGIQYSQLALQKYPNDELFRKRNDFDFRVNFAPKIPFGAQIKNIEEQSTIVQVPLRIGYYFPLKGDFYVLGKVGTDLDISGTRRVNFSFKDKNTEQMLNNINSSIETKLFNNYMVSLGMEKRFNNFSIQVSPSYTFEQKKVSYRKDYGFGGELKLNYTF
ncbi:MAG: hypothetical protein ACOVQ4_01470 [Flectobacillus sp.]|uniref:hypothetical protein n=1 Tax=Flectobacillus sp. TaxID=50419 RepID=UPI003B9B6EA9